MPSLIDLRRRIRAVKNTQQITKAMKMVAASKLRRAQERDHERAAVRAADAARPRQRGGARRSVGASAAGGPRAAARQQDARHRRVGRQRAVRQLQHERHQGGRRALSPASQQPCELESGRPQGPRFLRPPRVRGAVRADRHLPEAPVTTTRRRIAQAAPWRPSSPARSIAWCSSTTSSSRS